MAEGTGSVGFEAAFAGNGNAIAEQLLRVARLYPERPALLAGERQWRFAELAAMSERFAAAVAELAQLTDQGRDGRVAVLLEDRAQTIVAMLAVVSAGYAHVTLDPLDPDERIRMILGDCQPFLMLTDASFRMRMQSLVPQGCRTLDIDAVGERHSTRPPPGRDDALAYLYYTSGSTGEPKGVCHTQRNLLHLTDCYSERLEITPTDRLSALYSLSFAASLLDTYPALLNGAAICLYDMRAGGIPGLADWINRQKITLLHAGATVFRKLMAAVDAQCRFDTVRAVVVGGDTLFSSDLKSFSRHFRPDCRFINSYSVTEMGVVAQYSTDAGQLGTTPDVLPVGGTIPEVEVRIQRPDGTEAAPEEPGEIVIHSPFLTPGYWQRPQLNEQRFSADPQRLGWRCFHTGDQGYVSGDGPLYFLGRAGNRVKLRGYTIELSEVESRLRQCAGVVDAAVIAQWSGDGHEVVGLSAYVVPQGNAAVSPPQLRRELSAQLPRYMLPNGFHIRAALPLTATGKVDREALFRDAADRELARPPFELPAGPLERGVAALYEQILGIEPVGRQDDFFLLGGDSLSSVQLKVGVAEVFGRELPQAQLLEDASVAAVAQSLGRIGPASEKREQLMPVLVPVRKTGAGPALFMVHGRHGNAHVSPAFLRMLDDGTSLYMFQARGLDGRQAPHRSIEAMAEEYVRAMREVQPSGPYLLGGLCSGGYVAIEMGRQLRAAGQSVAPLLLFDPVVLAKRVSRAPIDRLRRFVGTLFPAWRRYRHQRVLRSLQAAGRIHYDRSDPDRRRGAGQVVIAFEDALSRHRLEPYEGGVELLLSADRLGAGGWGDPAVLQAAFPGDVRCHEVAASHGQALDVTNERLIRQFRESLRHMRQAVSV